MGLHFTSGPDNPEALLFGGAAGGGKTSFLIMAAVQYADFPEWSTLILRKTSKELEGEDGIKDRMKEMYADVTWNGVQNRFTYPSGATVSFGHLADADAHLGYQGLAFKRIIIDESTNIPEFQIRYMFSRLRRRKGDGLPTQMILASNPGGASHNWHKGQFVDHGNPDFKFLPSFLEDNPHLDQEDYRRKLAQLDPVTRLQLESGDWNARITTGFIDVKKIKMIEEPLWNGEAKVVRSWDLAATDPKKTQKKPDYTVGAKVSFHNGMYCIEAVNRFQKGPADVEDEILGTADLDGTGVTVLMEQEPGASGKIVASDYSRKLAGYRFKAIPATGSKIDRARLLSSAVANENVYMVKGSWNQSVLDEWAAFPTDGVNDDTVDAGSQAVADLSRPRQDGEN